MGVVGGNNVPISDVRITGGAKAKMMIVGTGSGVVEAWPAPNYADISISFNASTELGKIPVTTFGQRTAVGSQRWTMNSAGGKLSPIVNNADTYCTKLVNRQFDGNDMTMTAVVGSPIQSIATPSALILGSDIDGYRQLGLAFGSNGLRLFYLQGTSYLFDKVIGELVLGGDTIKVVRLNDFIQVYLNGVLKMEETSTFFDTFNRSDPTWWYPGVSTYAGASSTVSTPIGPVTIHGSTRKVPELLFRESLRRVTINTSTWTELASGIIVQGGLARINMDNVRFAGTTSISTREFYVQVNGSSVASVTNQNGGSSLTQNVNIPNNATISIQGYSSSSPNRTVDSGLVTISAQ